MFVFDFTEWTGQIYLHSTFILFSIIHIGIPLRKFELCLWHFVCLGAPSFTHFYTSLVARVSSLFLFCTTSAVQTVTQWGMY